MKTHKYFPAISLKPQRPKVHFFQKCINTRWKKKRPFLCTVVIHTSFQQGSVFKRSHPLITCLRQRSSPGTGVVRAALLLKASHDRLLHRSFLLGRELSNKPSQTKHYSPGDDGREWNKNLCAPKSFHREVKYSKWSKNLNLLKQVGVLAKEL